MKSRLVQATLAMVILIVLGACGPAATEEKPYVPVDFSKLKGMPGFSDKLLDMHFALYQVM